MRLEIVYQDKRSTIAYFEQADQITVMRAAALFLRTLPGQGGAMAITQDGSAMLECLPPKYLWKKSD